MCLNPINIINRSKFLSKDYRQPYFMQVRCGKCVECQRQNSLEWHYRSFHHFRDCVRSGGYVLFDTLTYAPEYLPHLSDFMSLPSSELDYPCFSYVDIRLFLVRLRKNLNKLGYPSKSFSQFVVSEYGTSSVGTHRPHYHILFFVNNSVIPYNVLSEQISKAWKFGRTDGLPYKSDSYVRLHNVIEGSTERSLRVTRYVSKYVMKSCVFQKEIDRRVSAVVEAEAKNHDSSWIDSYDGRKYRRDLLRYVGQFHRQSRGFGISALSECEGVDMVTMPDLDKVVCRIPLPMYYKRKLYQEQITIDGQRFWSYTEKGIEWLKKRESVTIHLLANRLQGLVSTYHVDTSMLRGYNLHDVARYMVTGRGFFTLSDSIASLSDKLQGQLMFNYVTQVDYEQFGLQFISNDYYGVKNNYFSLDDTFSLIKIEKVRQMCYFNPCFELFLKTLTDRMISDNINKTRLEMHRERMRLLSNQLRQ